METVRKLNKKKAKHKSRHIIITQFCMKTDGYVIFMLNTPEFPLEEPHAKSTVFYCSCVLQIKATLHASSLIVECGLYESSPEAILITLCPFSLRDNAKSAISAVFDILTCSMLLEKRI